MEVDTFMQIPNWEAIRLAKRKSLAEILACVGPLVFNDYSATLHRASYQKYTTKLLLQYVSIKGKQVTNKWGPEIEIKNANPCDVMELHMEIGEALAYTMDDQEKENARLKQRIYELEATLSLNPSS